MAVNLLSSPSMPSRASSADQGPALRNSRASGERRPWWRLERFWGLGVGAALGLSDLALTLLLGIHFEMNGRDVTLSALLLYGGTFAATGLLFGLVLEARRRDRSAAAIIAAQSDAVAATRARLAQSEKLAALGQLAAAIAHEVRNALGVIRSAAQELNEGLPASADADRASSFIAAEIDRLGSVVSSLLSFARPLRLAPSAVSVEALFDQALLLARKDLESKDIRISCAADAALPLVRADSDLAVQVLLELLSNAAAVVPRGGEVRLEARPAPEAVEIDVADSGPGVPEELRARIFEPFFTAREGGTGLGLAVARQIVEAHAGRIEVAERPGGGALFRVWLPAAEGSALARSRV